jgi:catechol 2,3-dioxygenase-like lactoylglutathione lyase family enzyme
MADQLQAPSPTRVVPYANARDVDASRAFYTEVLGFDVAMEDPVLGLTSPANPSAQVLVLPAGFDDPQPQFGVDVGDPEAVDAAHTAAVQRGLRVVYALRDEPWGVRRASSSRTPAARSSTCSPTQRHDVDHPSAPCDRGRRRRRRLLRVIPRSRTGSSSHGARRLGRTRRSTDRRQHDLAHPGLRRLAALLAAVRSQLTPSTDADGS